VKRARILPRAWRELRDAVKRLCPSMLTFYP
jgi:hypothetical protein